MYRAARFWIFILAITTLATPSRAADEPSLARVPTTHTHRRECQCGTARCECGTWLVQQTENFTIYCAGDHADARRLPSVCEALRSRLQENWLSAAAAGWDPKCIVVVHRTAKGYTARLGRGSEGSSGCASLESEGGRVVARRIDLRGDADDWLTAAFPHELTHIVLADRFGGRQPPRWVDEGIAILAEPETKQLQRLRAFEAAEARRQIYSARELMAPAADRDARRRDAFYWQSASLVAHLVEQGTSEQFLTFVDALMRDGTEHALRQVYEIPSLAQLESRWRPQTLPGDRPESSLADHIAQITSARRLRD